MPVQTITFKVSFIALSMQFHSISMHLNRNVNKRAQTVYSQEYLCIVLET